MHLHHLSYTISNRSLQSPVRLGLKYLSGLLGQSKDNYWVLLTAPATHKFLVYCFQPPAPASFKAKSKLSTPGMLQGQGGTCTDHLCHGKVKRASRFLYTNTYMCMYTYTHLHSSRLIFAYHNAKYIHIYIYKRIYEYPKRYPELY